MPLAAPPVIPLSAPPSPPVFSTKFSLIYSKLTSLDYIENTTLPLNNPLSPPPIALVAPWNKPLRVAKFNTGNLIKIYFYRFSFIL